MSTINGAVETEVVSQIARLEYQLAQLIQQLQRAATPARKELAARQIESVQARVRHLRAWLSGEGSGVLSELPD